MSKEEFWKVSGLLLLADNHSPEAKTNKLHKIQSFHTMLESSWRRYYAVGRDLTIDEAIISYSGRLSFLQFVKGKPTRWGIKAFLLASSDTGYVYKMKVYAGKEQEKSNIKQLVETMVDDLEANSHILYTDNYYTSIELLRSLRRKGIRSTGTIRKSRIRDPEIVNNFSKEAKGTIKFFTNTPDCDLNLLLWRDKRDVYFLSNHRDCAIGGLKSRERSPKP